MKAFKGAILASLSFTIAFFLSLTGCMAGQAAGVEADRATTALVQAEERAPREHCDPQLLEETRGGANGYGGFGDACQGYFRELSTTEPLTPISLRSLYIVPESGEPLEAIARREGQRVVWVNVPVADARPVMILIQAGSHSANRAGFRKTWAMTACRDGASPDLLFNRGELQNLMRRRPRGTVHLGALATTPSFCEPVEPGTRLYLPVGFPESKDAHPGSSFEAVVDFHPKPLSRPTFRLLRDNGDALNGCTDDLKLEESLELRIRCPLPRCRSVYSLEVVVDPATGSDMVFELLLGRENCGQ